MFDDDYLDDFIGSDYDKKLFPGLEAIWEKYGVSEMRDLVIDKKFIYDPQSFLGEYRADLSNLSSYSIINGNDKDVMTLDGNGVAVRYPGNKSNMMTKLHIRVRLQDIHNVKLPKITGPVKHREDIGQLISAVMIMHFDYLKSYKVITTSTKRNPYPIEFRFSINLTHFLDKKRSSILYIPGFNISVGHPNENFNVGMTFMDVLHYQLDIMGDFNVKSESWSYAYVVDNCGTMPVVWTAIMGKPVRVNVVRNRLEADGLYVYSSEIFEKTGRQVFHYPIEDLKSGVIEDYGFSINKENVIAGKCNSNYRQLECKYNELVKSHSELEEKLNAQKDVVKELEKEKESNEKLKAALVKALSDIEEYRTKERIRNIELARLKEQTERSKQDLKDSKDETSFRTTGTILALATSTIGVVAGIKKLFT